MAAALGRRSHLYQVDADDPRPPSTSCACTPIRAAPPIRAMSATTPSATCWSATAPCRVTPCCRPSASTPSASPPRTPPSGPASIPGPSPTPASPSSRPVVKRLGAVYDWRREIRSHDPVLHPLEPGHLPAVARGRAWPTGPLAPVNWCPGCQTVLANEQVLADGTCERSGDLVIQRELEQWFFRTTRLRRRAAGRTRRPRLARAGQDHAAQLDRAVRGGRVRPAGRRARRLRGRDPLVLRVFTTRPDTSFGMTYAVVAPEHPLVDVLTTADAPGRGRRVCGARRRGKSELDRTSEQRRGDAWPSAVPSPAAIVVNPFTGQAIPVYVADYVLMRYGTGAIMAVPAEDEPGLGLRPGPRPPRGAHHAAARGLRRAARGPGDGRRRSTPGSSTAWTSPPPRTGPSTGSRSEGIGQRTVNYRLRDWLVSRQRYWGCPIPVVYCPDDGIVGGARGPAAGPRPRRRRVPPDRRVPSEAPLRRSATRRARAAGARPSARPTPWTPSSTRRGTSCASATRGPTTSRSTPASARHFMPVDQYIGGIEHAILHLLYAALLHPGADRRRPCPRGPARAVQPRCSPRA